MIDEPGGRVTIIEDPFESVRVSTLEDDTSDVGLGELGLENWELLPLALAVVITDADKPVALGWATEVPLAGVEVGLAVLVMTQEIVLEAALFAWPLHPER